MFDHFLKKIKYWVSIDLIKTWTFVGVCVFNKNKHICRSVTISNNRSNRVRTNRIIFLFFFFDFLVTFGNFRRNNDWIKRDYDTPSCHSCLLTADRYSDIVFKMISCRISTTCAPTTTVNPFSWTWSSRRNYIRPWKRK